VKIKCSIVQLFGAVFFGPPCISLFTKRRQKQHTDKNRQKDTHAGLKAK